MKRAKVIWMIVAASLILLGGLGFVGMMSMNHWNFNILNTSKYETNTHEIREDFRDLEIKTATADLTILPSEDGICRVVCQEQANKRHEVKVENGSLVIRLVDNRRWYDHISIGWGNSKLTVYLPKSEYESLSVRGSTGDVDLPKDFLFRRVEVTVSTGDVTCLASATEAMKIRTDTGHITLEDLSAESVNLTVSTGRVQVRSVVCEAEMSVTVSTGKAEISDLRCGSLFSTGSTGDLNLVRVVASDRFAIDRDTGDVTMELCDAEQIGIRTDTGDVTGSLLGEKVFFTKTDTGKVSVPKTAEGGRCEIITDTGDIRIRLVNGLVG